MYIYIYLFIVIATFVMIIWVVYLIRALGGTASNFLSPTLANVCKRFKVSHILYENIATIKVLMMCDDDDDDDDDLL